MKVVFLPGTESVFDERRRLGLDVRDEMWDEVVHVVPPPGGPHQRLSGKFFATVLPVAEQRDLVPHMETGLFASASNYRVPDQLFCRPEHASDRGAEGAELVVEVRSPGDETYDKIAFYAAMGVREMLVLHPEDRRVELFRAMGGSLVPAQAGPDGAVESEVLGITLRTIEGKLRITWADGSADV